MSFSNALINGAMLGSYSKIFKIVPFQASFILYLCLFNTIDNKND